VLVWPSPASAATVPLVVGNDTVPPVSSVRNLGIYVDADLSMRTHVLKTTSGCFAVLRRIKSIQRSVSVTVLQSLMVALVLSRLDYGSTLLAGLPKQLLDRLQSVQNAAARLVFAVRVTTTSHRCFTVYTGYESLNESHSGLQYLRTVASMVQRQEYLTSLYQCVSGIHTRQRLRSASSSDLMVPR